MNIHDAAKKAAAIDGLVVCARWPGTAIKPTNGIGCCLSYGVGLSAGKAPYYRWQPKEEDLLADDWFVIKTIDELPLRTSSPS